MKQENHSWKYLNSKQEFNDVVEAIQFSLIQLNNMGYKMTDQFVAKIIAKYCVDVAPSIVQEVIKE